VFILYWFATDNDQQSYQQLTRVSANGGHFEHIM